MNDFIKFFWTISLIALLQFFSVTAAAQGITVSGTVTEKGQALPGVSVQVKGTTTGTVTDFDGHYSFVVPNQNAVLQFSYIGFLRQEVTVGNQTVINVEMQEDTYAIDEVVVVAYGTQKRGSITGSITAINPEVIENFAVTNLSNALAGRLSGVAITTPTSRPGASSSIFIRAQGTINNSDPLYVIDGVVSNKEAFDALDASEVENISVLKDGSSAAIYGSRSANGVVMVSTKRGRMSKPVITYSGSIGVSDAVGVQPVMTAYEHAKLVNDHRYYGWLNNPNRTGPDPSVEQGSYWFTDDELDYFKTTDYWSLEDEWRTPVNMRHVLNVTGGSEAVRYFIGGSYLYNKGSFENLIYKKYNFRASIDAQIAKNLSASLNLSTNFREDQNPMWPYNSNGTELDDLYKGLLLRTRMIPSYINGLPVANNYIGIEQHPGMNISKEAGNSLRKYQMMNVSAEVKYNIPFIDGLQARFQYNRYSSNRLDKDVQFPYTMYLFTPSGKNNHYIDENTAEVTGTRLRTNFEPNYIRKQNYLTQNYQFNFFLNYNKVIGKHAVDGLLLYEQFEQNYEQFDARRLNLISIAIPEFFAASPDVSNSIVGNGGVSQDARISYVGRLNYAFDSKYLLEAVLRIDGSVKFAPDKRWGYFPSLSAGWILSDEEFFKNNINFLNFFKLRASFSSLGNDAVGGWQWMPRYNLNNDVAVFEDARYAILPGELPNPMLTWEKSTSYNLGFDSRLMKNRLSFSFEYFTRRTTDILDNRIVSVPTTLGVSLPRENYSIIGSKGLEMEANWREKSGKDFSYNLFGNFGWAKSWWIKRDEANNIRPYRSEIGQPLNRIWGYECTGIVRTEEEAQRYRDAGLTLMGAQVRAGVLMYKDVRSETDDNPDGNITGADQVVIVQNQRPRFTFGFGGGINWKGLSADIFFQGLAGHQKLNNFKYQDVLMYTNNFAYLNDYWRLDNLDASMPITTGGNNKQNSSHWVRDASFLRCKLATISYDLPKPFTNSVGVDRLRLFIQGTNLFLFKHKIFWGDPETSTATSYPVLREFTFGINITI